MTSSEKPLTSTIDLRVTIDFETYWTKEYSLSKMPTQAYIRDKHFEVIGMGVCINDGEPRYINNAADIQRFCDAVPWDRALVIAHNAIFDGTILEWVFGAHPAMYFCTVQAANAFIRPFTGSSSLAKCAEYMQLPAKIDGVLVQTQGKRGCEFTEHERAEMARYCKHDTWLARELHSLLAPKFPPSELELIDLTIKKHTRPQLMLDKAGIDEAIKAEDERRDALLKTLDPDPAVASTIIMSNPKFAEALRARGVEPPMKVSPATGRQTYAFSKKDLDFLALQDHEDPDVQELVAARLGAKSTLEKTRLQKFKLIASTGQYLGVPLLYYGAGTGRFSGQDGLNVQNLSKKSALRKLLIAPPGHKIVAADLSQIEARLLATVARQDDLVLQFQRKEDVYSNFASKLYGKRVTAETYPDERFVGKCAILQLGYSAGGKKFYASMTASGVKITEEEAIRVVRTYRSAHTRIVDLWNTLNDTGLHFITGGSKGAGPVYRIGPILLQRETIILPNGMPIFYPDAKVNLLTTSTDITYASARGKNRITRAKLYGGMLAENIMQALARVILTTAEIRLARMGIHAAMQVHDELVFVIKDELVDAVSSTIRSTLTRAVQWLPMLPVDCTISVGSTYKEAK